MVKESSKDIEEQELKGLYLKDLYALDTQNVTQFSKIQYVQPGRQEGVFLMHCKNTLLNGRGGGKKTRRQGKDGKVEDG